MNASLALAVLGRTWLFGRVDSAELERLADAASVRDAQAGEILFSEGAVAQCLYVIVSGRAEEAMHISGSPVPLAVAGEGEVLGEEALGNPARTYCSTVTALETLKAIAVPLAALPASSADFSGRLAWDGDALDRARLVKRATAFHQLQPDAARRLASSLVERRLEPGDLLIRQGCVPQACWIVESGTLEARLDGACVASLGPGDVISEVSLAAGEEARADVAATADCRVLELSRDELLIALQASGELRAHLGPRARIRLKPIRVGGVESHTAKGADGSEAIILKDPVRLLYFRLSPLGAFVWSKLDGTNSFKDLVVGYLRHSRQFAIEPIARVVEGLMSAGFARARGDVSALMAPAADAGNLLHKAAGAATRLLNWHVTIGRGDRLADGLFRLFRPVATVPGMAILAMLAALGLVMTLIEVSVLNMLVGPGVGAHPLLLVAMAALGIFLHEAAHGVGTKAIGRSVNAVGIGWHWVVPVLFVDTTDTWLATPRQRLAVTLAGPLINGALAGASVIAALALESDPWLGDTLWGFAFVNSFLMLFNLWPLMNLDGYVALTDAFQKPALRADALADLKNLLRLPGARPPSEALPLHLCYLGGSLIYSVVLAWFAISLVANLFE